MAPRRYFIQIFMGNTIASRALRSQSTTDLFNGGIVPKDSFAFLPLELSNYIVERRAQPLLGARPNSV